MMDSLPTSPGTPATVLGLLSQIAGTGRDRARGGYTRPVFSAAERDLRAWFIQQAEARGLDVEFDRNGGVWAWWDIPGGSRQDSVVTGSHLDSVPGGGGYDGPLGIASALVAVDALKLRMGGRRRALAVTVFAEEEGSRFGVACMGSQLMTGRLAPDRARNLRDSDGKTFAEAARTHGIDPHLIGREDVLLSTIGAFVELHVEQGRGLADLGRPVAIASSSIGHGRWRIAVSGQGNHAGTTLMEDRKDALVAAARIVVDVRERARAVSDARATVGRITPTPGGTNAIASRVDFWLDARHPDERVLAALVRTLSDSARAIAAQEGCTVDVREESLSPTVGFDPGLIRRLSSVLPEAPLLATGAGHDACVLAAEVPAAMLFVRNPTGVSHSPEEHVQDEDAEVGADALTDVLEALLV